jgi:hypothetical protein
VNELLREEHRSPCRFPILAFGNRKTGVRKGLPAIRAVDPRRGLDEALSFQQSPCLVEVIVDLRLLVERIAAATLGGHPRADGSVVIAS